MKNIILGVFLICSSFTYAQYAVTGKVLNESNGEPVVGGTIILQKPEKATATDIEGEFTLTNLPGGTHNLVVSSLGFRTQTIKFTVPGESELQVYLSPTAIEIEEVIVSTPFHQLQSENVMKVERATLEELSRTGAINLSEGITKIAGVESVTTGSGIGKPVIRGLSSNRVLVYAQGVRLENQQFGDEHGLGISSSGVESVEVIKGPASLLYGSDALGGVLYLNPERYAPVDSTAVDAGMSYFSNTLGVQTNFGFKSSRERLRFLVRGNYETHSDYQTGNGLRATNTRFNEWDIKSGIGYRDNKYAGDLRYNLNSNRTGIPHEIGLQSKTKEISEPYQAVENHILSFDNTFYLENSSLDVKLGYVFNNRKEFEGEHEEEGDHEDEGDHEGETEEEHAAHAHGEPALEMRLSTLNYNINYNLPRHDRLETIVGIQGMYQNNKNLGEEFLIPDANITDFGVLVTTHYHLSKMDFQAGLRYDHRNIESQAMGEPGSESYIPGLERSFNSYNGALGMRMDLSSSFMGRINFATGFRAPNLAELTSMGSHHGTNRFEIGNPNLENEQNFQVDLTLEYGNKHIEVFGNAFYNRINDYIYLNPTGAVQEENPVFEYVQNDAELYGGEAGFHLHPHPLDWLHLESSYELVIGKQEDGTYLPLIPAQSILNTFRAELGQWKGLESAYGLVSLKSVFDQNKTDTFETPTSGYSLVNAGIGGTIAWGTSLLELKVSGNNLLNKEYYAHLSRLKYDGILNMGRNISLSARIFF